MENAPPRSVQGVQGNPHPLFGETMPPPYVGAAMRQAAADRLELELERARVVRLENKLRDLNAQLVRAGALQLRANGYREDLEQERETTGSLRVEVNTLREDLEQARAIAVGLSALIAAVEAPYSIGIRSGY